MIDTVCPFSSSTQFEINSKNKSYKASAISNLKKPTTLQNKHLYLTKKSDIWTKLSKSGTFSWNGRGMFSSLVPSTGREWFLCWPNELKHKTLLWPLRGPLCKLRQLLRGSLTAMPKCLIFDRGAPKGPGGPVFQRGWILYVTILIFFFELIVHIWPPLYPSLMSL